MKTFNLEGAIIERAHSNLRALITVSMVPMRDLISTLDIKVQQSFRKSFDQIESQLFQEMREPAEKQAMDHFIKTYDEVASIVNSAHAKERK